MPRRLLFCLVGVAVGLMSWAIAAHDPLFSFVGRSGVGTLALLGAGWSVVVAAVIFSTRGAGNRTAVLLLGVSVAWFVSEWDNPGARWSPVFTGRSGVRRRLPGRGHVAHAGLPDWPAHGRTEHVAVALGVVSALLLGVAPALFFESGAAGSCRTCPANLVAVWTDQARVVDLTRTGLGLATLAAAAAILGRCVAARRGKSGAPPRRHSHRRSVHRLSRRDCVDVRAWVRCRLRC